MSIIDSIRKDHMAHVKEEHIKAKTSAIKEMIKQEKTKTKVVLFLSVSLIIIGLGLFLFTSNPYFLAIMASGVFILSAHKPKLGDFIKVMK